MDTEHKFNCVFCKEYFDDKESLQTHFIKHADPNFNREEKNSDPQNESETAQEKSATKVELVSCDVCTDEFPTISKAITHKHKMHPDHDAKYFCEWCGKLFTMKHLYNKHFVGHESMKKIGEEVFHCDSCDANFNVPSAMIYHNKFFHRQDTDMPAIGHSKKQKLVQQELVAIYYCAFCGEEYLNKVNLHKHITDDHGDENQSPDEVLRCPLCDAIFYHLDAYEAHLTTHASDDIYSTGKNMIAEDLTEFTLDSVPPVLEKVQNVESEEATTSMDINKLLRLTGADDDDNDSNIERRKHKKHKKHKKKSKKEKAITLDEFLNMNTDVFGEGLDFQGIEEVPTQIVTKRLKRVKPPGTTPSKMVSKSDLDKLKQLGIAVKIKRTNNVPISPGIKIAPGTNIPGGKSVKIANSSMATAPSQQKIATQEATTLKTPPSNEDVLKKLMGGQNDVIISKKPMQVNVTDKSVNENVITKPMHSNKSLLGALRSDTPENIEVDCDLLLKGSSETERESSEMDPEEISQLNKTLTEQVRENINNPKDQNIDEHSNKCTENEITQNHVVENETETSNNQKEILFEKKERNTACHLNVLKNLSQHLTIKPVRQTNTTGHTEQPIATINNDDTEIKDAEKSVINFEVYGDNVHSNSSNENDQTTTETASALKNDQKSSVKSNIPVNFKNISQGITIKCAGKSVSGEAENNTTKKDDHDEGIDDETENTGDFFITKQISTDTDNRVAKSLDALKNLGIHVSQTGIIGNTNGVNSEHENSNKLSSQVVLKENATEKSLDALKSLGIIIKSQKKIEDTNETNFEMCSDYDKTKSINENALELNQANIIVKQQLNQSVTKSFNVQKDQQIRYNKPSFKQSTETTSGVVDRNIQNHETHEDSDFSNDEENFNHGTQTDNISHLQNQKINDNFTIKPNPAIQNISKEITVKSPKQSPNISNNVTQNEDKQKQTTNIINSQNNTSTKPAGFFKKLSPDITIKSVNPSDITSKSDVTQPEIFSIEDSDSEEEYKSTESPQQHRTVKVEQKSVVLQKQYSSNINKLINDDDNVTNRQVSLNLPYKNKVANIPAIEESNSKAEHDDDHIGQNERISKDSSQKQIVSSSIAKLMNNKNINIKNMQSINQVKKSPKLKKETFLSQHAQMNASFDGFLSNESSDEGNAADTNNMEEIATEIVMNEPNSDNEDFDYEKEQEMESANQSAINKLKRFNQNISIKSSNANVNTINKTVKSTQVSKESSMETKSHAIKRVASEFADEDSADQTKLIKKHIIDRPTNQAKISHQQTSAMNAVNQEVTTRSVKTVQTKTLVQEITTTVTRTIKTVNQEVVTSNRQMMVNSTKAANIMRPKIVQGMRPFMQQGKHFHGVAVRQATPVIRPQFRPMTPGTPVRPAKNTAVRSVRPAGTVARQVRPSRPRMPTNFMSEQSHPRMGKPLTIAPNIKTQQVKQKNAMEPEPEGHFSCFKKPKESLFPELSSTEGGSSLHVASSSQMARSFSSSEKTVNKFNTESSSLHMKSEVQSSSQQVNRISNVSGLSIMKSSKSSQAAQEVHKCEVNAPKRSTLDAIEKLQRQGLLVKKPRLVEPDDWENSDSDGERDPNTGPLSIEGGG